MAAPGIALLAAVLAGPISGCARLEQAGGVEGAVRLAMDDLRALGRVFLGEPSPRAKPSAAEAARQAHAELLNELFQVVLLRAPLNEAEFGVFLGTLTQGASLEGVYNGFTHSAIYRSKEMKYGPASAAALQAFARTMAELQQDLKSPTMVDSSMAKPLPEIDPLSESDSAQGAAPSAATSGASGAAGAGGGVSELRFGKPSRPVSAPSPTAKAASDAPAGPVPATSAAVLMKVFEDASLFTLKRVLGDEVLKVLNQQQARGGLALWYGAFAARQAGKGVDFGLALRNKADEAFHAQWAEGVLKASQQDRLTWEVLNRVHRILNHAELTSRREDKSREEKSGATK